MSGHAKKNAITAAEEPQSAPEGAKSRFQVRPARVEDASAMTDLCGQLGYPATAGEVARRLGDLRGENAHAVFVAVDDRDAVAGWVEIYLRRLVVADMHAEIGGLIVDAPHRGKGAGRLLMEHAEVWAGSQGASKVYVRSNIVRRDAHAFYEKIGYECTKTSHLFTKQLTAEPL